MSTATPNGNVDVSSNDETNPPPPNDSGFEQSAAQESVLEASSDGGSTFNIADSPQPEHQSIVKISTMTEIDSKPSADVIELADRSVLPTPIAPAELSVNKLEEMKDATGTEPGYEDTNTGAAESQKLQAQQIRTQVEYYFSDENLIHDVYLYGKMKGSKGEPVPIGLIHSFKKMRFYQPLSLVVDALRSSETLNVVKHKDKECVVRKKPFSRRDQTQTEGMLLPRKEKPTGFEEYYTDPPITPQVFEEERELYDPDEYAFADRIEMAIQRYKARRRFKSKLNDIWTKFMKFGGIITGPRPFSGGLSKEDLEDKSAAEIARMSATEFVGDDKYELGPGHKWETDFEGVAKAFLSTVVIDYYGLSNQAAIKDCTNLLHNFYNYLLHHNVCPEYSDDINAARKICVLADQQLLGTYTAVAEMPGDFNMACSFLFGGRYSAATANKSRTEPANKSWAEPGSDAKSSALTEKKAKAIFSAGLAAYATHDAFGIEMNKAAIRKAQFEQKAEQYLLGGFEITEIVPPSDDIRDLYETTLRGNLRVLGKMHCKPWKARTFMEMDLPPNTADPQRPSSSVFWVEQEILDSCFVGMKFMAEVITTTEGLVFIDNFTQAFPSYHTVLENELMCGPTTTRKWKEPKVIPREEHLAREAKYQNNEDTGPARHEIVDPIAPG